MTRPKTREVTLYRLPDVTPTLDGMFDAFTDAVRDLDDRHADLAPIKVAGQEGLWIGAQGQTTEAEWCGHASLTTGLLLSYTECRAGGVLLFAVDGIVYALSYGTGHRLILDEMKDQRFGLRFLIRQLNSDQVHDLVRRRPGARGRTDSTLIPTGAPVWTMGVTENADIIGRIGGVAKDLEVTFAAGDTKVRVKGGAGLHMRWGVEPSALVRDIREIERVCREEQPDEALAFIDYVQPVAHRTATILDATLDHLLADDAEGAAHLVPVVPVSALDSFAEARSFTFRIGGTSTGPFPWLEPGQFLSRTRVQRAGKRVAALRDGHVWMNEDGEGLKHLLGAAAVKWLEASLSHEGHSYFLMDGTWYEIGDQYVERSRQEISRVFPAVPSVDLPAWALPVGRDEEDYNEHVAKVRRNYTCLDRNKWVRDPHGRRSSLEICDLLGPDNELIHVKRAKGSAPLSHLFSQGLVSAQNLLFGPADVRTRFAEAVADRGNGRQLAPDFPLKKVVYAILLDNGKQLSPSTLFPFSQVTLAHAARTLHTYGIEVEVIGIPAI